MKPRTLGWMINLSSSSANRPAADRRSPQASRNFHSPGLGTENWHRSLIVRRYRRYNWAASHTSGDNAAANGAVRQPPPALATHRADANILRQGNKASAIQQNKCSIRAVLSIGRHPARRCRLAHRFWSGLQAPLPDRPWPIRNPPKRSSTWAPPSLDEPRFFWRAVKAPDSSAGTSPCCDARHGAAFRKRSATRRSPARGNKPGTWDR